jgi:hypothetical protein
VIARFIAFSWLNGKEGRGTLEFLPFAPENTEARVTVPFEFVSYVDAKAMIDQHFGKYVMVTPGAFWRERTINGEPVKVLQCIGLNRYEL